MGKRVLSVFSGIGGLDLAAEAAGWVIAGQIEIDPFCQAVLAKHWPHVKRMGDIREVKGDEFGPVDLLAAGFPCQPTSLAGKRQGKTDDRWLWPELYCLIAAIRPRWIMLENTAGLLSMGIEEVLTDLEGKDDQDPHYEAQVWLIPACAVGAPHQRERVFIVAHTARHREGGVRGWSEALGKVAELRAGDGSEDVADANGNRQRNGSNQQEHRAGCNGAPDAGIHGKQEPLADATSQGRERQIRPEPSVFPSTSRCGVLGNASGAGWTKQHAAAQPGWAADLAGRFAAHWGAGQIKSQLGRVLDGVSSWLDRHRWPAASGEAQKEWEPPRVTQEDIPNRRARLKALGNSVVPQQCFPIFAAIMAADEEWSGLP